MQDPVHLPGAVAKFLGNGGQCDFPVRFLEAAPDGVQDRPSFGGVVFLRFAPCDQNDHQGVEKGLQHHGMVGEAGLVFAQHGEQIVLHRLGATSLENDQGMGCHPIERALEITGENMLLLQQGGTECLQLFPMNAQLN